MRSSLATVAVCLASLLVQAPSASAQGVGRILVMPFENVTRDNRIVWLGEAASVLIADALNAKGANAITREARREAFGRLQIPSAASLTSATIIRVGQIVGASRVVMGTLEMKGDVLVVRARELALESARVQTHVVERGAVPDLFGLFDRVASQIAPAASITADRPGARPSVAAFERYIKGLLAETPASALAYLNAAIQAQPGFDVARLAIWEVHDEQADHTRALAAVSRVPETSDVYRRARFLAGLSQLNLQRNDEAFQTFKALADARPTPTILNNLGVVQLRRGGTPQAGMPTYYFNLAAEADKTEPDYFFNLGYAYWLEHDAAAAAYWLREAVRRNPADGDAHYVLGTALAAAGSGAEATRERELARRLSSTYTEWEKRPGADSVPKGLERIKNHVELPHASRIVTRITTMEQKEQAELATFYLDRSRRLFQQENDRDAVVELNHALYLSPYLADAHFLLGRIHLRNGRVHDAIDAFKIVLWSAETADAHAALGEAYRQAHDVPAARAEAERALVMDPASADAKQLLARLDGR